MTKVELLKHMLANVEAGKDVFDGITSDCDAVLLYNITINTMLARSGWFSVEGVDYPNREK